MHENPNMPVIYSIQNCSKGGGVYMEEGPHVVEDILVWFYINQWEGFVRKIHDNLVNGEIYLFRCKGIWYQRTWVMKCCNL